MGENINKIIPTLSIRMVMDITKLSARQIRYYEEHELVSPLRTKGKRRLYSFEQVEELMEIQNFLDQGINIAGIKKIFEMKRQAPAYIYKGKQLTEKQLRLIVAEEYLLTI